MQHNNKKSENYNNDILEPKPDNYWVNKDIYLFESIIIIALPFHYYSYIFKPLLNRL